MNVYDYLLFLADHLESLIYEFIFWRL